MSPATPFPCCLSPRAKSAHVNIFIAAAISLSRPALLPPFQLILPPPQFRAKLTWRCWNKLPAARAAQSSEQRESEPLSCTRKGRFLCFFLPRAGPTSPIQILLPPCVFIQGALKVQRRLGAIGLFPLSLWWVSRRFERLFSRTAETWSCWELRWPWCLWFIFTAEGLLLSMKTFYAQKSILHWARLRNLFCHLLFLLFSFGKTHCRTWPLTKLYPRK